MIKCFFNGLLSSNVYVIYDKGEGIIIDCGVDVDAVADFVKENDIKIKHIVLTHGHYDHIDYLNKYLDAFADATPICHTDEIKVMLDSEANVSAYFGTPRIYNYDFKTVSEGDIISVGDYDFSVLHTPGHTPGSICLLCKDKKLLFTGDVLFQDGYGRTDFKYGDRQSMRSSLIRILSLDPDITFYSGHGDKSKIKYEQG